MGMFSRFQVMDSFRSLMTGLGVPGRDKTVGLQPICEYLTQNRGDLEALYRSSWIAKKIVDIPAFDATRAWRNWDAEPDAIEKLENTERDFGLQKKVLDALIKARLYGGSAMLIGIKGDDFTKELDLDSVGEGDLAFVHVVEKNMIAAGARVRDITSPWFGEPNYYMRSNNPVVPAPGGVEPIPESSLGYKPGETLYIHPSRVVRIVGTEYPDIETAMDAWGDSVLQSIYEALRDAGLVTQSLANMISDSKVDVFRMPGLTQLLSTDEGTNKMLSYLSNANVAKSTINALVLDKEIEWARIQTRFEGLPEVLQAFLFICSGAADIPATRLFGREPTGMNSTGESDVRNYYDRISSDQKVRLTPLLNRLDEVLIRSTLGSRPKDIHYEWNPLWQMSDSENADIALKKAQAFKIDNDAALIPSEALLTARINQLVEDGTYPGLDAAMDELDQEYEDDHMEFIKRIPPSPEEMIEMQAANKPAIGNNAGGGGKQPAKPAKPAVKDQSSLSFLVSNGGPGRSRRVKPFRNVRRIRGPRL